MCLCTFSFSAYMVFFWGLCVCVRMCTHTTVDVAYPLSNLLKLRIFFWAELCLSLHDSHRLGWFFFYSLFSDEVEVSAGKKKKKLQPNAGHLCLTGQRQNETIQLWHRSASRYQRKDVNLRTQRRLNIASGPCKYSSTIHND